MIGWRIGQVVWRWMNHGPARRPWQPVPTHRMAMACSQVKTASASVPRPMMACTLRNMRRAAGGRSVRDQQRLEPPRICHAPGLAAPSRLCRACLAACHTARGYGTVVARCSCAKGWVAKLACVTDPSCVPSNIHTAWQGSQRLVSPIRPWTTLHTAHCTSPTHP